MRAQTKIYLGLGSNIGNRIENIKRAVRLIKADPHFKNVRVSHFYETLPVGPKQRDFINAVLAAATDMSPVELLSFAKDAERSLGRKKRKLKWGPREIDIDILFFNDIILNSPDLVIPHPAIQERRFVLIPFAEIEGNFKHPILKKSISEMLSECNGTERVEKIR